MSTGQVKWFNNAKGFGFILPDDGGSDLFAHYSSIGMEGYKTLKAGQMVSFEIVEGPKGLHAANIIPIDNPEAAQQADSHKDGQQDQKKQQASAETAMASNDDANGENENNSADESIDENVNDS
tara:strand:+ start:1443 stop:1814 length:372 start_codon:yes stop_codon:yes gene_type:complete